MGNRMKEMPVLGRTAMTPVGSVSYCPNCDREFPPSTTYEDLDRHVTQCLETFKPTDQERLKMNRRKKSTNSQGSDSKSVGSGDFITVQVYVKKVQEAQNNQHQDKSTQTRRPFKWMKSHLTYSQELLSEMPLKQISKQNTPYKFLWLHQRLSAMRVTWKQGAQQIKFHPNTIVKDSLKLTRINLFKELKIIVTNDVVYDAGGLLREWASMLLKQLINTHKLLVFNKQGYYSLNPYFDNPEKLNNPVWPTSNIVQNDLNSQNSQMLSSQSDLNMLKLLKIVQELQRQQGQNFSLQDLGFYKPVPKVPKQNQITYRQLYQLLGCLLSKILIDKVTIPIQLDHLILTNLLELTPDLKQSTCLDSIFTFDKQLCESIEYMQKILEHQDKILEQQLQALCLTFSVPSTAVHAEHQLISNGKNIQVTSKAQLKDYIQKLQLYYLYDYNRAQMKIIKDKFYKSIKPNIFGGLLECYQFQLLVNGVDGDHINVQDWENGTQYKQPYSADHKVIKFFWATVRKMKAHEKMRLLKFVTGSQRLPVFGFKHLQTNRGQTSHFVIHPVKYDKKHNQFPKAHTCFNRLILPIYPNQATLAQNLIAVLKGEFDGIWGME